MPNLDPPAPPIPAVSTMWSRVLLAVLGLLGLAILLSGAMARIVTYDEDQYLGAGLAVSHGLLPYRDFTFLQAPLYPFVLGGLFKLTGGWFLLSGRLLTFVLSVFSAVLLWRLLRRLGAGPTLAAVLLAACLASPFLSAPLANTRNDALPLTLFLAGLSLQPWDGEHHWGRRFAAALLMGLAFEAKVTYLFGPAVLLVHSLFAPGRRLVPVVAGTAVAGVPGALLLAVSGWDRVRFGLLDYHLTAPGAWYRQQGLDTQLDAPVRMQQVLDWLFLGGNLTLLVLSVALALITVARKRNWKRPGQLLVGLLVGAVVLAFLPSPSWAMYFAPVAPLLACCIAHLDRVTAHSADPARKRVLFAVAALPVIPVLLLNGPEFLRFARGEWVGLAAHRTALSVRAALPAGGPVATLFPHAVMDANPVPVPFLSGPFVFRSGGVYSADLLGRVHALSPATLAGFIERDKPAAIFAGSFPGVFRTPMDAALTEHAERHDWRLGFTAPDGGRLWLNPAYGLAPPDVIPRAPN